MLKDHRKYDKKKTKRKILMKRFIEYEKRDEVSKRNIKHVNKNIKYQTKRMYDEHFEHGRTKPMTKPQ